MTVVIGIAGPSPILAADSRVVVGDDGAYHTTLRKVRRCDGYLIGFAGDSAAVTRATIGELPAWDGLGEPVDFVGGELLSRIDDLAEGLELEALALVGGELIQVDGLGQLDRRDDYAAIGSGAWVACGALHSTRGKPAKTRARLALLAAYRHVPSVGPPWVVVEP